MKLALDRRFGFLVNEIARLYSQQFDALGRQRLGLSQAQCRVIAVLAAHEGPQALSQTELAGKLGLSTMAVAGLCDRMAAAGWIRREPHPSDRRANHLYLEPRARKALERALAIGDELSAQTLAGLSASERAQLITLLGKARSGLMRLQDEAKSE
jgi:DNA-binding MarR family transcriptional regulator